MILVTIILVIGILIAAFIALIMKSKNFSAFIVPIGILGLGIVLIFLGRLRHWIYNK